MTIKTTYGLLLATCLFILISLPLPAAFAEESNLEWPEIRSQEKQHSELEAFARRMYDEAMDLFRGEDYKTAGMKFKELIYLYPGFSMVQEATFLMGESFFKIGMWKDAQDAYKRIVTKYKATSKHVGESYYKLEQIEFKLARYMQALSWYRKIETEFADSKYVDGARYTGGNCHYELGEYEDAETLFNKVNPSSEFYGFALYSTALCFVQNDRYQDAIDTMRKILAITNNDILTDSLKGRVHVTLGRLFYELSNDPDKVAQDPKFRDQQLDLALSEFDRVGSGDKENYDKALLGKGWVYIRKANDASTAATRARTPEDKNRFESTKKDNYRKAGSIMERITSMGANSELAAEAWLTRAHCQLGLGQYEDATRIYNMVIQRYSAEAEMKQADPQVAEVYNDIMDEYEAVDKTGQMAVKLREICIDQGRNDLIPKIDREMAQVDRLRQDLSKLEMWFFDRSTSGASINYGSKFGLSIIKFEKEEKTSEKIEEIASSYAEKTQTLVAEQEKLRKRLGKLSLEQGQSNLGMELREGQAVEEGVILFRNGKREFIRAPGDIESGTTPEGTGTEGTTPPELKETPGETKPGTTPEVKTKPEETKPEGEIKPEETKPEETQPEEVKKESATESSTEGTTEGAETTPPPGTIVAPGDSPSEGESTTPPPESTTIGSGETPAPGSE